MRVSPIHENDDLKYTSFFGGGWRKCTGRAEWDACLAEAEGEGYEVLNAEALRTEFEDRIGDEGGKLVGRPGFGRGLGANKLFQGIAESFPALSEGGFYYCLEEFLVTAQAGPAVAP